MALSLDHAPEGVSEDAWMKPFPGDPDIGDLWLLSWDSSVLGLCIVVGVAPSFVLVWPAALETEPAFKPAMLVEQSPIGSLSAWPTRETGVGNHLLHRKLGSKVLSERLVSHVFQALEEGTRSPLSYVDSDLDRTSRESISDDMVDRWEWINTHVWPPLLVGETPFVTEALQAAGLRPSALAALLSMSISEAVPLYGGETSPSEMQVSLVAGHLGVSAEELLVGEPGGTDRLLISPGIKEKIVEISHYLAVSESRARSHVQQEYTLAARSNQDPQARLDAAIDRLLRRGER